MKELSSSDLRLLTLGAHVPYGYSSHSVCVCLSVTMLAATYPVYTSQVRCHRVVYGIFKISVVWLLLKMLRSNVLV